MSVLRQISPDEIKKNPENPRIFFRAGELDTLQSSIRKYGIQVPINVYQDGGHYVLIDGERRLRCATKLNLKSIPALVQDKPTALNNLLLMFNIHALREQWDFFTIANKLPNVISLYRKDHGREPNEIELSEITGLTRSQIRRCRMLIELPDKYKNLLLEELKLPKHQQKLSEDFFIEMEKALRAVTKRNPKAIPDLDKARDALITKYRDGIINNIVDFRKLSKIASATSIIEDGAEAVSGLIQEILDPSKRVDINSVYAEHFEFQFDRKKILTNIKSIYAFLGSYAEADEPVDDSLRDSLIQLNAIINQVLEV